MTPTPTLTPCTPTTCAAQGLSCGSAADGCGNLLDCGTCTWTQIYNTIFGPRGTSTCAGSSCHTSSLGGFACGTTASTCYAGMVSSGLVTPGSGASSSALVDPARSPLCGSLGGNMPVGGTCITAAQLTEIQNWLASGAPDNTGTPAETPTPGTRFIDNGDGTITDNQTGLMWEKKDQAGDLHNYNGYYSWAGLCGCTAGSCTGSEPLCQADASTASLCSAATGGALGCSQCSAGSCGGGNSTIWAWLNKLNAAHFAGHSDWRIPTIGQDGGTAELETLIDTSVAGCGSGSLCVPPAFNTGCTAGCTVTGCSCTASSESFYWSATTYAADPRYAWIVYASPGHVFALVKWGGNKRVRAVRSLAFTPTATSSTGTPTATVHPVSGTATPTPTPTATLTGGGSIPRRAAGASVELVQGLRALPAVISAFTHLAGGTAAAPTPKPCNGGGSRSLHCTQTVPGVPPRNYTLSFSPFCTLNTAAGGTVTLQGAITAQATDSGLSALCSVPPVELSTVSVTGLQITAKNAASVVILNATVDVMGSVSVTPDVSSSCHVSGLDLRISTGTITVHAGAVNLTETFDNTDIAVTVSQFSPDCVPVKYSMTLNGATTFAGDTVGGTLAAIFTNFIFTDDSTSGNDSMTLNGQLNSTCLGTAIMLGMDTIPPLGTDAALTIPAGGGCPSAGSLRATEMGTTDRVTYTASGGVQIDLRNNGGAPDESYDSCLNPSLYACPAGP